MSIENNKNWKSLLYDTWDIIKTVGGILLVYKIVNRSVVYISDINSYLPEENTDKGRILKSVFIEQKLSIRFKSCMDLLTHENPDFNISGVLLFFYDY